MADRISLDEHQDSLLTDEERAAIADDTAAPAAADDDKGAKAEAAAGDEAADEDDDDDDGDDEAGDDGAAEPAAATAKPAPAVAEAAADDDDDEPVAPVYRVALPSDFAEKMEANKAALTELRRQRDEGEISSAEFDAQVDRLTEERDDLRRLQARHDVAEDMRKQSEQAQVNAAWGRTLKAAEADGIDYRTDKEKHHDFDLMIKALANNPANNDRPLKWFFAEAHKRVMALHGINAKSEPATPADKRKAAADSRKPDLSGVPKTLADVPGDGGPGSVDGDEFADIDQLDGLAFEDALAAKMKRDADFANKYTSGLKGSGRKAARVH